MNRKDFIYWDRTMTSYGAWLRDGRSIPGNQLGYNGNCAFDGMPIAVSGKTRVPLRFRLDPELERIHGLVLNLQPGNKAFVDRRWLRGMSIKLIAELMQASTRTAYRHAGHILEYISRR